MKIAVSVAALVLAASWMPAQAGRQLVVVNLSQRDLNLALQELYEQEGPRFEQSAVVDDPDKNYRAKYNYALEYTQPVLEVSEAGLALSFKILHAALHADSFEARKRIALLFRPKCWDMDAVTHAGTSIDVNLRFKLETSGEGVRIVPANLDLPISEDSFDISKPAKCRGAGPFNGLLRKKAVRLAERSIAKLGAKAAQRISQRVARLAAQGERLEATAVFHSPWNPEVPWAYTFTAVGASTQEGSLHVTFATNDLGPEIEEEGEEAVPAPDPATSYIAASERLFEDYLRRWVFTPEPVRLSLSKSGAGILRNEAFLALIPSLRQLDRQSKVGVSMQFLTRPSFRVVTGESGGARIVLDTLSVRANFLDVSSVPEPRQVATIQMRISLALDPYSQGDGGLSFRLHSTQVEMEDGSGNDDELLSAIFGDLIGGAVWNTEKHPIRVRTIRLAGRAELGLRSIRADHGYLRFEFAAGETLSALPEGMVQAKR